jgi:ATP-binding cassette subfamily B protein
MKKRVCVKQQDITDCGAACLASVSAHYKRLVPIARIRQQAATSQRGTNMLGMIEAAQKLGFTAKGVRGTAESLAKIPKPAIAHVIVQEKLHHFVVIYDVTPKAVTVMDPADGRMHRMDHETFRKQWTGVLVIMLPDQSFRQTNEKTPAMSRFWQLVRPHKWVMLQAVAGALVYTILGLSTSVYLQKIVDHVLVEGNHNLMNLMGVVMILLLLIQMLVGSMKSFFALKTGQHMDAQLILGYYKHLLRLPQQFFDTMRVGEIISRVNDAVKIRTFINDTALNLLVNTFIVAFSFALMFTYYWKLALVMLLVIPLYALIYTWVNKVNRKRQRALMEHTADLEAQLVESLHSVATIKRFNLEGYTNLKTETRFVRLLGSIYGSASNAILSGNATELVSRLFTIIMLWAGAYFVLDKQITPGELLSFYALVGYLTGPASSLVGANKSVQDALIAGDRLFEIMDLERETTENKLELKAEMVGDIQFKEVHFRYGTRTTVFDGFSLSIPKGKLTAVVGESGSGKTTLLSLLQHIYPLHKGNITIGGLDISHLTPESLRQIVGVVPQQIDLFAGTVIANIAVGEFEPDMLRIIRICHELGITDFVEKLPEGFHTLLGENGAGLSGGQKQRIAIARALYRNPEILVLDEATSSLDSLSEKYVQQTIERLRGAGKTVILIAHRLTTVMKADHIAVIENGKLREEGTHQELLGQNGAYYRLWSQQFPVLQPN